MNEARDQRLLALFAAAEEELDGRQLTRHVIAATRRRRWLWASGAVTAGVLLLAACWAWLSVPLLDFALLISGALTSSLVDLGEGWLALLLLPINSLAGLLALTGKAIQVLRRRLAGVGRAWR